MSPSALMQAALAFTAAQAAPEASVWSHEANANGVRMATVAGTARFGEIELPARLSLQCAPGEGVTVSWSLVLEQASQYGEFGLDAFEGPDAEAGSTAVTKVRLIGGLLHGFERRAMHPHDARVRDLDGHQPHGARAAGHCRVRGGPSARCAVFGGAGTPGDVPVGRRRVR